FPIIKCVVIKSIKVRRRHVDRVDITVIGYERLCRVCVSRARLEINHAPTLISAPSSVASLIFSIRALTCRREKLVSSEPCMFYVVDWIFLAGAAGGADDVGGTD